jgi:hypothetical protein
MPLYFEVAFFLTQRPRHFLSSNTYDRHPRPIAADAAIQRGPPELLGSPC